MAALKDRITEEMKNAMRAGEKERLATIRLILSAIKQREVDERIQLDDNDPLPHGMTIWQGTLWYCNEAGVICRLKIA